MITRKEFLSLSSLGIFSLLFPGLLFSKGKSEYIYSTDVNALLKSASDLRKQKQYNQAKQLYQQIITQYPSEIRAYDGMRKVLLTQKKGWEVILLFKAALLLNPNNVEIKQRLYKEYLTASLGNKKIKNLINFNGRLLSEVKQKYETFLQNSPNNKNIQKQYAKIAKLLEWNADTQNPNQNTALKTYNKQQYKNFKKRFDQLSTAQLETKLNALISKPFSADRKQHIRELYNHIIRRHRKEKNNSVALSKALAYYNTVDKNDPLNLKYIRDLAKLQKNYDVLITVETQNHTLKNSFWSALALLDAYIRKAEHDNMAIPSQVQSLLTYLETNSSDPRKNFEVITRKIKIDILKNQPETAKNKILEQSKNMMGITNPHYIDIINVLSAMYYKKTGDTAGQARILKIAIDPESFIEHADPLIKSLAYVNLRRSTVKPIHIQNLNKLLHKI